MKRSIHICTFFSCLAILGMQSCSPDRQDPNVIIIVASDLGIGDLGCYGQTVIETPNIDKLASKGILFSQSYCGSPQTSSSKCILLTGMHSGHAAIRGNLELGGFSETQEKGQQALPDKERTMADLFRENGYATAAFGTWGLGLVSNEGSPMTHGFDQFYGSYCQKIAHNHYPTHLWDSGAKVYLETNTIFLIKSFRSTTTTMTPSNTSVSGEQTMQMMSYRKSVLSIWSKVTALPFLFFILSVFLTWHCRFPKLS